MKTDAKPETYRIHELRAENFKRLQAVTIRPDGKAIQIISGRNGQGKTSTLDAIMAAIAGKSAIQKRPIRKGQKEASVFLDLGSIHVTRTFAIDDGGGHTTTALRVENADGNPMRTPQAVMDALMGDLAFDPLEFTRLDDKKKFELLKRFVPEVDFNAIADDDQKDREERTAIGRRQREKEGAAATIMVPQDTPDDPVDVEALLVQHGAAKTHNQTIDDAERLFSEAEKMRAEAASKEKTATDMLAKLPTQDKIDLAPIEERGRNARAINEAVARKKDKAQNAGDAKALERQYSMITTRIEQRAKDKQKAIAEAKMPIDGITFGEDNSILFNDLPFDQASAAEQLRISTAIAMALNPNLRVILIRDGSLLDQDSLALLAEIAEKNDYQVFLERVATGDKVGIVIEDGRVSP